jgi:L-tartrate/succinate antiporter
MSVETRTTAPGAGVPGTIPSTGGGVSWKLWAPLAVAVLVALIPPPQGLAPHAWYYFAVFAGVITGLILEPLPGAAVGLIGVAVVMILAPYVYFSPEQLAKPGFKAAAEAIRWGLSGFSNTTVWLIFAAFMFARGYEKTGLGKRIALLLVKWMGRRTLTLGYAVTIADMIIAPFTPSNTARSAGTIYPVIRNLPGLYDSKPNDPSARRMGSYLMWMAITATCVTSTMFLTGLAPNPLAVELVRKTNNLDISWVQWFKAMAPFGILMLLALPLIGYVLYAPEVKGGPEVPAWAAQELEKQGGMTRREILLAVLVLTALSLWIFGSSFINATTVAVLV